MVTAIEATVWDSITDDTLDSTVHDPHAVREEVTQEVNAIEDADRPESVEQAAMDIIDSEIDVETPDSLDDVPGGGD